MPQTPHVEKHFTASESVRDIVIGMSDGLTVPFALAAGLSGAVESSGIIVTAGLAEVAAGAIAMGLGGYMAARTDAEHFVSERAREERETEEMPEKEAAEVADVLRSYGLEVDQQTKKIAFDIGQPVRSAGGARRKNKYTSNDFVAEDTLERRVENDRKNYYDDVIACIKGAEALLILGPGEAKGEFSKHIKAKKVRGVVVELETADKMTDRQVAAKVQQHFATSPAKKSVAPKKTATKAAKATAGKRTKRSGK